MRALQTRRSRLLATPAGRPGAGAHRLLHVGGHPARTATAVFGDVGDLANGAQVQMADVPVGSVSSIGLDGDKAKVSLTFDQGVRIPADVSAAIARTTILGDQFVQLVVPKDEEGAGAAHAPAAGERCGHHAHLDGSRRRAIRAGGVRRSSAPSRPPSWSRSLPPGARASAGRRRRSRRS